MISAGDRHVVAVASTVADVVSAIGTTSPDLCLLDRWFYDGDALDVLPRLQERDPGTKLVVLTADPDRNGAQQALDRGAEGFVHKTRVVSALLSAIERVLAGATVVELPPRRRVSGSVEANPLAGIGPPVNGVVMPYSERNAVPVATGDTPLSAYAPLRARFGGDAPAAGFRGPGAPAAAGLRGPR